MLTRLTQSLWRVVGVFAIALVILLHSCFPYESPLSPEFWILNS